MDNVTKWLVQLILETEGLMRKGCQSKESTLTKYLLYCLLRCWYACNLFLLNNGLFIYLIKIFQRWKSWRHCWELVSLVSKGFRKFFWCKLCRGESLFLVLFLLCTWCTIGLYLWPIISYLIIEVVSLNPRDYFHIRWSGGAWPRFCLQKFVTTTPNFTL